MSPRSALLAAASGLLATLALLASPVFEGAPPVELPPFPLDLRLVALPALFPLVHLALGRARWPLPAVALPALAMLAAVGAHFQASPLLDLVTDLPGSEAGGRVAPLAALLSGGAVLLALAAGLDRARERLDRLARAAGVPAERVAFLGPVADAHAARSLGFAAAAFAAFVLAAAVADAWLASTTAPVPELLGALLALGVAAAVFPKGVRGPS